MDLSVKVEAASKDQLAVWMKKPCLCEGERECLSCLAWDEATTRGYLNIKLAPQSITARLVQSNVEISAVVEGKGIAVQVMENHPNVQECVAHIALRWEDGVLNIYGFHPEEPDDPNPTLLATV